VGRIFRAFFWMRWRILVNSLEKTGARDTLERFSLATEKLGPIIALVLLVPTGLALFVLGTAAGFGLATGDWIMAMEIIRFFLVMALALTLLGPVILPTRTSGSVVRMLLLPIPRVVLYLAQMTGAIADPWVLLIVPVMIGVPIGLAIGLKFGAALVALLAGVVFMFFVMGLTSLASSIVHLLLRDRRRGDIVMLILVLVIPVVALAPQMLMRSERKEGRRLTRAERQALPPSATAVAATRLLPYVPSEIYRRTAIISARAPLEATVPLATLGIVALVIQAAGFAAYRRVLDMPVSLGTRRAGSFGGLWKRVIPGLTPAASAVAFTQLRTALRTPRGRATIASPLLLPVVFAAIASQSGRMPLPGLDAGHGLGLAGFGVFASIVSLIPLAMNQFAMDRAGFTRYMLSPLTVRELLAGKAVGNGLIAAIPAAFCLVFPALMFPGGRAVLWLGLLFSVIATYVLITPVAAALSAIFPKAADLNSIGSGSNAHQGAGLLGILAFAAAGAPSAGLAFLALKVLGRADLVAVFLLLWCALAFVISHLLFIPVRRLVASRCEALAQYY
jgi:hypothetical protein